MSQSKWGNTTPDIIAELEERGVTDPAELPDKVTLERWFGKRGAKRLLDELDPTAQMS